MEEEVRRYWVKNPYRFDQAVIERLEAKIHELELEVLTLQQENDFLDERVEELADEATYWRGMYERSRDDLRWDIE